MVHAFELICFPRAIMQSSQEEREHTLGVVWRKEVRLWETCPSRSYQDLATSPFDFYFLTAMRQQPLLPHDPSRMCCAQSHRFKLPWIEPMKPDANLNPLSCLSQVFYQGDTKLSHSRGRSMRRTVLTHRPVVSEMHQTGIQHQTDHSKPTKEQPFLYIRGIYWTELGSNLRTGTWPSKYTKQK